MLALGQRRPVHLLGKQRLAAHQGPLGRPSLADHPAGRPSRLHAAGWGLLASLAAAASGAARLTSGLHHQRFSAH